MYFGVSTFIFKFPPIIKNNKADANSSCRCINADFSGRLLWKRHCWLVRTTSTITDICLKCPLVSRGMKGLQAECATHPYGESLGRYRGTISFPSWPNLLHSWSTSERPDYKVLEQLSQRPSRTKAELKQFSSSHYRHVNVSRHLEHSTIGVPVYLLTSRPLALPQVSPGRQGCFTCPQIPPPSA